MRRLLPLLIGLLTLSPALAFAGPVPFITLGTIMEQPVCREGEPVFLALVLHSNSTERCFIGGSAFEEASFDIVVTDSAGKVVPRTAVGERVLTSPTRVYSNIAIVMAPGRSLLYRFNLARLFDLSRTGTYTINVSRRLRPEIWPSKVDLPSPPSPKTSQVAIPPAIETLPQTFTLTTEPLTVRMTEDAAAVSGSTAYAPPPSHQPPLYTVEPSTDGLSQFTSSLFPSTPGLSHFTIGLSHFTIGLSQSTNGMALAVVPPPLKLGSVAGGLAMSAFLPADVLPSSAPVILTVILKNVTKHPVRLGTAGTDMASFRLSVMGPQRNFPGVRRGDGEPLAEQMPLLAAGQDLLLARLDAAGPSQLAVVSPGKGRQYRFVLSRLVDMTVAGHYAIQITRILPGGVKAMSPIISLRLDGPFDGNTFNSNYSVQIR